MRTAKAHAPASPHHGTLVVRRRRLPRPPFQPTSSCIRTTIRYRRGSIRRTSTSWLDTRIMPEVGMVERSSKTTRIAPAFTASAEAEEIEASAALADGSQQEPSVERDDPASCLLRLLMSERMARGYGRAICRSTELLRHMAAHDWFARESLPRPCCSPLRPWRQPGLPRPMHGYWQLLPSSGLARARKVAVASTMSEPSSSSWTLSGFIALLGVCVATLRA